MVILTREDLVHPIHVSQIPDPLGWEVDTKSVSWEGLWALLPTSLDPHQSPAQVQRPDLCEHPYFLLVWIKSGLESSLAHHQTIPGGFPLSPGC